MERNASAGDAYGGRWTHGHRPRFAHASSAMCHNRWHHRQNTPILADRRKPEQSPLTMCGYISMGGNPDNRLASCPETGLRASLLKKHIGRYDISKGRARRDEEREGSRQGNKHPPCSWSAHKKKSLHPAKGRKTKAKNVNW